MTRYVSSFDLKQSCTDRGHYFMPVLSYFILLDDACSLATPIYLGFIYFVYYLYVDSVQ
jgi:hypothetical protein